MWPYDRPPPPQPAFAAFPQYGAPGGGFYGTGYPPSYGGSASSAPTFQGAPSTPWNPIHGGAWNQDSLAQSFNTMTLHPPPPSEWYADSGAGSHMSADAGKLCTISPPTSSTPSSIIVGNGAYFLLLPSDHTPFFSSS
jgi:hypothetical protein